MSYLKLLDRSRPLAALGLLLLAFGFETVKGADTVEFNRDVRPILSDNCFHCHGPDKNKRKADLRLDTEEGPYTRNIIVPSDPGKSELVNRLTCDDEAHRMPPIKSGRKVTPHQIELIRRWIEQGANWQKHWAFLPPQRPDLPQVKDQRWPRNPIDPFILARLDKEGLTPSTEANRATLIRRVTLDLTGLPPTPEEVDAFINDASLNAYEKVVDRLLANSRYGERMAIRWLEAARYADTSGYQSDGERFMWRWRDWVIDALNRNMPFDQFTIEQLAGDLLPNATLDQKIATGFNRNHRGNGEGGVIAEEYAVEYVADRVETTSTVWLGLTLGCARCHDHKFDPVSQKEFYQLFAFFNNVPENGKAIKHGNSPPLIASPTPQQQEELKRQEAKLKDAEEKWKRLAPELDTAQEDWASKIVFRSPNNDIMPVRKGLQIVLQSMAKTHQGQFIDGHPGTTAPPLPGDLALIDSTPVFNGEVYFDAGDVGKFGFYDKFSFSAWVKPSGKKGGTILSRMKDEPQGAGYGLEIVDGRLRVNLVQRWLDDALRVEMDKPLQKDQWQHIVVSYDGSRYASGVKIYLDGRLQKIKVLLDELNQTFETNEPFRVAAGGGKESRFHGAITEVYVYDRLLSADEAEVLAATSVAEKIFKTLPEKRTTAEAKKIRMAFLHDLDQHPDHPTVSAKGKEANAAFRDLDNLKMEREKLIESFSTTMVMEEMPTPRATFVLQRGAYDKPGEKVAPGVPATLPAWPQGVKPDRLAFARWLVDPQHPLTARVAVNRAWQMFFGAGLVRTVDDFGSQGEPPTHPELLDWLATEFVRTGWNVKTLHRAIVTSATYRQSSRLSKDLVQRDPDNKFLARGPRLRLSAEMIRDQALSASGLLVERLGGPSVRPYQPAGLLKDLTGTDDYKQDHGPDLYRRGLYTFWKRTVAPPTLTTFDAALRETCVVRQTRTNTPLQALTLMNDVTFVETARVLAQRVMREETSAKDRVTREFRLIIGRQPKPAELALLVNSLQTQLTEFVKNPSAARNLIQMGESPLDPTLNGSELAAYTTIASLIMNLDETITRE